MPISARPLPGRDYATNNIPRIISAVYYAIYYWQRRKIVSNPGKTSYNISTFQGLIAALQDYWSNQGCIILQPLDIEVGAGTFHPATFLRAIGPEPWNCAYVQPSRRPTDGRYGENPNRLQHYYQFQVLLKPSPMEIQELYLGSLTSLGFDPLVHDIRFVEDNWESPTLGAWGLGWEVWLNGMEVTQFTYFQQVGGLDCKPVSGEITYGLERLAMYLQGVESVFDLKWADTSNGPVSYRDVFHQNEVEMSAYNFEQADTEQLFIGFDAAEKQSNQLIEAGLPLPAYEMVLKASHQFNLLDARHAISVTERQRYMLRVRSLARAVAESYYQSREALGFPMLKRINGAKRTKRARPVTGAANTKDTHDLLIEIGTEELPPKALKLLMSAFAEGIRDGLENAGLGFSQLNDYASPRRLAVIVKDLQAAQTDRSVQRRGPALTAAFDDNGNSTRAAQGFASSCGVSVEALQKLETDKGSWLAFTLEESGQSAQSLIPDIVRQSLKRLPIPKRMRWGNLDAEFVRPVHWVILLFGDEVINTDILGVSSGRLSRGHRYHHPDPIRIDAPGNYVSLLEDEGKVVVDFESRKTMIREQVEAAAERAGGVAVIDAGLLDEVTSMIEWPVAVQGSFDARFLEVPQEVLISSMKNHQKYFYVVDDKNRLLPVFITISNIDSTDIDKVRQGNERVIRPRLGDADFFWQQDRKRTLESYSEDLKTVVFQKKLGSLFDKSRRVSLLAKRLAGLIDAPAHDAETAARLCKCDLMSGMVYEFPDLQGIMGRYYALNDGEPKAVANAIEEHYLPRFAGDRLPPSKTSQAVALADRLDTLVGIFGIGQAPTGDKDPFALRRAALGILRVAIEFGLPLDLQSLLEQAADNYQHVNNLTIAEDVLAAVFDFILGRLHVYYVNKGFEHDEIDAVVSLRPKHLNELDQRLHAVKAFRAMPEAQSLATANKRCHNLLKKAQAEGIVLPEGIEAGKLNEAAEKSLASAINEMKQHIAPLVASFEYTEALKQLAGLRDSVDSFFDRVMVMVDDEALRNNRLALLQELRNLFLQVADISCLKAG
ncbi:MAG: hypothetical protein BMS9Abin26_0903 [Gammaproteobacteria bacterium]|nr:MAG: hypothetical protein BMS9Abin26_0903 [Gammaproteobacteria bacterium]